MTVEAQVTRDMQLSPAIPDLAQDNLVRWWRLIVLLAGIGLGAVGCAILIQRDPIQGIAQAVFELNSVLNLQLPRPQNAAVGSLLLIAGAFLIGIGLPDSLAPAREFRERSRLVWPWVSIRRWHVVILIGALLSFLVLMSRMMAADTAAWPILLWLIPPVVAALVTFDWDRISGIRLSIRLARADVGWLLALLGISLAIAVLQLTSVPNSVVGDEGKFYERMLTILSGAETQSFFGPGVYTYPVPSSVFQAGVAGIFGPDLWSWRFASVLPAVLTIIPLYLFARSVFGRPTALIACLAMATLPYFLAYARLGYNNSQAVPLVTLTAVLVYACVDRRSMGLATLAGIAAGLGFYTYTAGRLAVVLAGSFLALLVLYQAIRLIRHRANPAARSEAAHRVAFLIAAGLVLGCATLMIGLPYIVFTNVTEPGLLNHKTFEALFMNVDYAGIVFPGQDLFRDFPPITVGDQTLFLRFDLYAMLLARGTIRTLLAFHVPEMADMLFTVGPLAGSIGSLFYFVGLVVAIRRIRQLPYAFLLLWWGSTIAILSILNTIPPRPQHMVPIWPVIGILIGVGMVVSAQAVGELARGITRRLWPGENPVRKAAIVGTIGALTALIVVQGFKTYFADMPLHYPPNMEMLMSFDAMAPDRPTQMVYLTSREDRDDWAPWMINDMVPGMGFDVLRLSDVDGLATALSKPGETHVYVDDSDRAEATRVMQCLLPGAEPEAETLMGEQVAWVFAAATGAPRENPERCAAPSP